MTVVNFLKYLLALSNGEERGDDGSNKEGR